MRIVIFLLSVSVFLIFAQPAIAQRFDQDLEPARAEFLSVEETDAFRFQLTPYDLRRMSPAEIDVLMREYLGESNGEMTIGSTAPLKEQNLVVVSPASRLEVNPVGANGNKLQVNTFDPNGHPTLDPVGVIKPDGFGGAVDAQPIDRLLHQGGTARIVFVMDRSGSMGESVEDVKRAFFAAMDALPDEAECLAIWYNGSALRINAGNGQNGWSPCAADQFDFTGISSHGGTRPAPILRHVLDELETPAASAGALDLSAVIVLSDGQNLSRKQAASLAHFRTPIMTYFAGKNVSRTSYTDISKVYLDHGDTDDVGDAFLQFANRFVYGRIIDLEAATTP